MPYIKSLLKKISFAVTLTAAIITSSAADSEVTLQWNPNLGDATVGYHLYYRYKTDPAYPALPVWEGENTSCTVSGLQDNTTYCFVVRAYDANGAESGNSNQVEYTTQNTGTAPLAPELLNPADGSSTVSLLTEMRTGAFNDPDAGDYHRQTQWLVFRSADDLPVLAFKSDFFLIRFPLPPFMLNEQTSYYWTARHYDQTGLRSAIDRYADFTTESWEEDENGDGVPDSQEVAPELVTGDVSQTELKCFRAAKGDTNIGIELSDNLDGEELRSVQACDPLSIEMPPLKKPWLPIGLINAKIYTSQPGGQVRLKLYFSNSVPVSCEWIGYTMTGGYQSLSSQTTFGDGRDTLVVSLRDGGAEDLDGLQNGIVVFAGGYGTLSGTPANMDGNGSSGGGGAGCFIQTLLP